MTKGQKDYEMAFLIFSCIKGSADVMLLVVGDRDKSLRKLARHFAFDSFL